MNREQVIEELKAKGHDVEDDSYLFDMIVPSYYRECTYCDKWVDVDEWSSEAEINGCYHYDICDDCQSKQ